MSRGRTILRGLVLLAVVCSGDRAHVDASVRKDVDIVQCPAAVISSSGRVPQNNPASEGWSWARDPVSRRYPFPVQSEDVQWSNRGLKRRPRMVGGRGPKVRAEIVPLRASWLAQKAQEEDASSLCGKERGDALAQRCKTLYVQRYKNSAEWAIFTGDELASLRRAVEAELFDGGESEGEHDSSERGIKSRVIRPRGESHFRASHPLKALAPTSWSGYREEGTQAAIDEIFNVMQEKMRPAVDGDFARFLQHFAKDNHARRGEYLQWSQHVLADYQTDPDNKRARAAVAWLVRGVWGRSPGATPFPVMPEDAVMHEFVRREARLGADAEGDASKWVADAKGAAAKARTRAWAPELRGRAEGDPGSAAATTPAEATVVFWKEVEDAVTGEFAKFSDVAGKVFARVKQLGTRMIVYSELYPDWSRYENEAKRVCDRDAVELSQIMDLGSLAEARASAAAGGPPGALASDAALQDALPASIEGLGMEEWEADSSVGENPDGRTGWSFRAGRKRTGVSWQASQSYSQAVTGGWFFTRKRFGYSGNWKTQPKKNCVMKAASGVGGALMTAGVLVCLPLLWNYDSD